MKSCLDNIKKNNVYRSIENESNSIFVLINNLIIILIIIYLHYYLIFLRYTLYTFNFVLWAERLVTYVWLRNVSSGRIENEPLHNIGCKAHHSGWHKIDSSIAHVDRYYLKTNIQISCLVLLIISNHKHGNLVIHKRFKIRNRRQLNFFFLNHIKMSLNIVYCSEQTPLSPIHHNHTQ